MGGQSKLSRGGQPGCMIICQRNLPLHVEANHDGTRSSEEIVQILEDQVEVGMPLPVLGRVLGGRLLGHGLGGVRAHPQVHERRMPDAGPAHAQGMVSHAVQRGLEQRRSGILRSCPRIRHRSGAPVPDEGLGC